MLVTKAIVTKSVTLRVADYESLRLEITLEASTEEGEVLKDSTDFLRSVIDAILTDEMKRVGYRGASKFVGASR